MFAFHICMLASVKREYLTKSAFQFFRDFYSEPYKNLCSTIAFIVIYLSYIAHTSVQINIPGVHTE